MADALLVAGSVAVGTGCYLGVARLASRPKVTVRLLAAAAAGIPVHAPEAGLAVAEVHQGRHMYSVLLEESRRRKFLVPGDGHKWTEAGDGQADMALMAAMAAAAGAGTAGCLLESDCGDQEIASLGGKPAQGLRHSSLAH